MSKESENAVGAAVLIMLLVILPLVVGLCAFAARVGWGHCS